MGAPPPSFTIQATGADNNTGVNNQLSIAVPTTDPVSTAQVPPASGWVFTLIGSSRSTGQNGQWSSNSASQLPLTGIGNWTLSATYNGTGNSNTPAGCSYNQSTKQVIFTDPVTSLVTAVTLNVQGSSIPVPANGALMLSISNSSAQNSCTIPAPGWAFMITPTGGTTGSVITGANGVWSSNQQNSFSTNGPGTWTISATYNGVAPDSCNMNNGELTFISGSSQMPTTIGSYPVMGHGKATFAPSGSTLLITGAPSVTWYINAPLGWSFLIAGVNPPSNAAAVLSPYSSLPAGTYLLSASYGGCQEPAAQCTWNNANSQVTFTQTGADSITSNIECAGGGGH